MNNQTIITIEIASTLLAVAVALAIRYWRQKPAPVATMTAPVIAEPIGERIERAAAIAVARRERHDKEFHGSEPFANRERWGATARLNDAWRRARELRDLQTERRGQEMLAVATDPAALRTLGGKYTEQDQKTLALRKAVWGQFHSTTYSEDEKNKAIQSWLTSLEN